MAPETSVPGCQNRLYPLAQTLMTKQTAHRQGIDLARFMDKAAPEAQIQTNHGEPVSSLCQDRHRKA